MTGTVLTAIFIGRTVRG